MVVAWSQNWFELVAVEISADVASTQSCIHMITEEGSHAAVSVPGCHASRHVSYVPLLQLDCCHVHVLSFGSRYRQGLVCSIQWLRCYCHSSFYHECDAKWGVVCSFDGQFVLV